MPLLFNLLPRKRLVKRLKEAAKALIKTLLFKAPLCRWEETVHGLAAVRSLRLPLVGCDFVELLLTNFLLCAC